MHKKIWRTLALALILALAIEGTTALAAFAVKMSKKTAVIDLAEENTLTLTTNAPASLKDDLQWKSKKTSIATVSGGVVTAKKVGKVQIGVRAKGGAWSVCTVTVKDSRAPKQVLLSVPKASLSVGETLELKASVLPSTTSQAVKWQTSKSSVVRVSTEGVITAVKPGIARIKASSVRAPSVYKVITVTVEESVKPKSVELTGATDDLEVGGKLTLKATVSPEDANAKIKWTSSDTTVATVSSAGVVLAKKVGKTTITATSAVASTVRASRTINVVDPNAVDSVSIEQTDLYLYVDKATALTAKVLPASSGAKVTWSSSDTAIVAVTSDGKAVGRKVGVATITAKAGSKSDNIEIRVLSDERETTLPEKFVASAGAISANHNKITDIYASAIAELEASLASKKISARERANRKEILQRGFLMYDVPWASDTNVRYWSGSTYYIADRIYFGMPYTQTRRTFNLEKWLSSVTAVKRDGYYQISNMPNTSYAGNDCSSYVSMCQFGYNSASSYLNSTAMYSSTNYTTVADGFSKLIPGDILVKNGHVAMFLYYVNADRIMVIEQGGGSEPNTTACAIKSISGIYRAQGYRVRRKVGIGS